MSSISSDSTRLTGDTAMRSVRPDRRAGDVRFMRLYFMTLSFTTLRSMAGHLCLSWVMCALLAASLHAQPTTLTQSTDRTTVLPGNSAACLNPFTTSDTSYWRSYDMAAQGIAQSIDIVGVTFGVESAVSGDGGGQPLTLRLYVDGDANPAPAAGLFLIHSETFIVADLQGVRQSHTLTAPVTVPFVAGLHLVVEIHAPEGFPSGNCFFIGSNALGENAPSYFSSRGCGGLEPVTMASFGFPSTMIVADIDYRFTAGGPILTMTQSFNPFTITPGNSVACVNNALTHEDNSYWRSYSLAGLGLVPCQNFQIVTVSFGIQTAFSSSGLGQPVEIRLYLDPTPGDIAPKAGLNLLHSESFTLADASLTVHTRTLSTPAVVPIQTGLEQLVVELYTPDGRANGRVFFIGSNSAGETAPSYVSDRCGNDPTAEPVTFASIDFPSIMIILDLEYVVIDDNTPPTITGCPANITVGNAPLECGAVGSWTVPMASDNCALQSFTSTHDPGDTFPVGTTTVTYTAADTSGNTATCGFSVTVIDVQNPVIADCPGDITVPNDVGQCAAVVIWTVPTASDNCAILSFESTHNPGDLFAMGTTTVTYTATDTAGITALCSFDVTVDCRGELVEQNPTYNSPTGNNTLGIVCGCHVSSQDADVSYTANRYGSGTILPHSGQEIREDVDLFIRGRDGATRFEIERRHLTRVNHQDSLFGPAWAFNYRHYFVQQTSGDNIDMFNFGRVDAFAQTSQTEWEGGVGRFERLSYDGASTTTLRMPGGTELIFHTETAMGLLVGHLTAIVSPNGNAIAFTYETVQQKPDLIERKLLTITESFGRDIDFLYQDPLLPDLVTTIRDFSGREVRYAYDVLGRLTSVRSPTVTSTGSVNNDFPAGKTTLYTYLDHPDPRLTNALTSIVFPKEQVEPGQPSRLSWTYEIDLADRFFGFVKTHTIGNITLGPDSAGGTYSYSYELAALGLGPNDTFMRTTCTDRRGTQTVMEFNRRGQMLHESVVSQGLRPGSPPSFDRGFTYNDDGDMTQSVDVLATTSNRTHSDGPRTSQANEILIQNLADARGGDQVEIRSQTVYEPVFNRPFKVIDPRGFEPGNTTGQFTTTFLFDYMENLAAATAIFAPRLGMTESELQMIFGDAGITSVGDVNGDGVTDQICGNVIKINHPDVPLPPQASRVGLGPIQRADEIFQYNQFGQLVLQKDAEENITVHEYFGANDPDGNGTIDLAGADPTTGGYLKRTIRDLQSGSGRNSGQNPPPVMQATTYDYTAQNGGAFPENLRGIPTSVLDPRGIQHTYLVNELDQVVKTVRAADVSASAEPGLTSFAYERITLYDENDNVTERRIQNKDTLDGDNDFIVTRYTYDVLDQRTSETLDEGPGHLNIRNEYAYDASQNLVQSIRGAGKPEAATKTWLYDERDILVSRTKGAGASEQSMETTGIDGNGNIIQWFDADNGDVRDTQLDGFDRVKQVTDRVLNVTVYTYDSASNVTTRQRIGPADEMNPPPVLLAQVDTSFDERNRPFRRDRHIFHYPGKAVGVVDDGALDPGDGLVSTIVLYDRLNRTVGRVDADDDTYETRYDGLARVIKVIDPLSNESDRAYDLNDNLVSRQDTERSPLVASSELFVSTYVYDALNRLATLVEPNGQTTRYEYDSRDNLIKTIDALGNEIERHHDRIDRLLDTRIYLSTMGTGASATNFDSAQGGGDGMITLFQDWDDLHRLEFRVDDRDNRTEYLYDDLDRKVECRYADGTVEKWTYNADSELLTHTTPNGSVETWVHDPDSRPTQVDIDNSGNTHQVVGTTKKTWGYDGLDRITKDTDNNGRNETVTYRYIYDSLSRKIRESQTVGAQPLRDVDSEWQGASRYVSRTYPNGRKVTRTYDALDRQFEIRENSHLSLITRFEYVGPARDIRITHGNQTVLDKRNLGLTQTIGGTGSGYDSNRRHLRHEWKTRGGSQITAYVNTYNGPGGLGTNRRRSELREHLFNHLDTYTFDSKYRMLTFDRDSGSSLSTRTLDGVDNMTEFSDEGVSTGPVVDGIPGMNQYSQFAGKDHLHDDNSNLNDDGTFLYKYDYENRLVQVKSKGSDKLTLTHIYANNGRRVQINKKELTELATFAGTSSAVKSIGQSVRKTRFLYSGWQVVEERLIPATALFQVGVGLAGPREIVIRQYVDGRGIDEHCQIKDYTLRGGPVYYYHGNSQGYAGALTDAAGNAVEYYEYSWLGKPSLLDADGMTELRESKVGNSYLFQGRRYDLDTGKYYYRHRYYDPLTGRFLHRDPLGLWNHGQGNGFSAFSEDGWNRSDPLGLADETMETEKEKQKRIQEERKKRNKKTDKDIKKAVDNAKEYHKDWDKAVDDLGTIPGAEGRMDKANRSIEKTRHSTAQKIATRMACLNEKDYKEMQDHLREISKAIDKKYEGRILEKDRDEEDVQTIVETALEIAEFSRTWIRNSPIQICGTPFMNPCGPR